MFQIFEVIEMRVSGWIAYLLGNDFATVRWFILTICGSTSLYLFSLTKGFQGASPMLRKLFPGRRDVFYDRTDFFVVVLFGSIIGTVFFGPTNNLQALAAGFGWISAVNVLSAPKITAEHAKKEGGA